ncbi:hypothetical protein ACWC9T_34520 [Kitasatospora sp. NPDC001159]
MFDEPDPMSALWPIAPSSTTDWLRELCDDDGLTGFMPLPCPTRPGCSTPCTSTGGARPR